VILHRLVRLSLVAAALALAPVAYASPPDDSSLAGLYDNADFDDVVLLFTSNLGAIQPAIMSSVRPAASVVALVTPTTAGQRPPGPLSFALSRAPPLA